MTLEGLANVRFDELTVVRRPYLLFLLFVQFLRGQGEDSERCDTKFSAGVTVKFTAPTTLHVEQRQPECSQRHSKCEQEDGMALSDSGLILPYKLDQSRIEAYTTGFSETFIFIPSPLVSGTNDARLRQGESKFLPCFS